MFLKTGPDVVSFDGPPRAADAEYVPATPPIPEGMDDYLRADDLAGDRDVPMVDPIDAEGEFVLHLRDSDRWSEYVLANHPFDVVGWDGLVYPFAFNAMDFEPIKVDLKSRFNKKEMGNRPKRES
jgi:hypothetical protein